MGDQSFARLIRKRRDALGLSQARLGELVGRSASTIRNWERAQAAPSERSDVVALAAVLGLNEAEVLERAGFESPVVEKSPTVEQAYASLTAEHEIPITVSPPEPPPSREQAAAAEPDAVDPEAASPSGPSPAEPEVTPVAEPASGAAEPPRRPWEAGAPPVADEPGRTPSEEGAPDFERFMANRGASPEAPSPAPAPAADAQVVPPAPRRPRRASPPTVLEAAAPSEPSYVEDPDERQQYRVRGLATAALVVGILIVLLWSFNRATDALGSMWQELIDSLAF
jgi:transcriptional regulator with XRE-family HTH domain